MKVFRTLCTLVVLCGMFFVFSTALVKADGLSDADPRIAIGGDPPSAPAGVITPSFSISTPSGTSPATSPCVLTQGTLSTTSPSCLFENDITISGIGESIYSLTLATTGVASSTVSCGFLAASPFSDCNVEPLSSGSGSEVVFSDGSIPFHDDFTLDFDSFPSDSQFSVQASLTTVPEPGTLALLLTGLGVVALLARRTVIAG
jgi:PEP-CTERM motif